MLRPFVKGRGRSACVHHWIRPENGAKVEKKDPPGSTDMISTLWHLIRHPLLLPRKPLSPQVHLSAGFRVSFPCLKQ